MRRILPILFCALLFAQLSDTLSVSFGKESLFLAGRGDALYITHTDGLTVLDITDRDNPVETARFSELRGQSCLDVMGDTLVCAKDNLFYFFDIADPFHPELIEVTEPILSYCARELITRDRTAYVSMEYGDVGVYDLHDIHDISCIMRLLPYYHETAIDMELVEENLYVLTGYGQIYLWDVSVSDTVPDESWFAPTSEGYWLATYDNKVLAAGNGFVFVIARVGSSYRYFSSAFLLPYLCLRDGYAWVFGDSTKVYTIGEFEEEDDLELVGMTEENLVENMVDQPIFLDNRIYILDREYGLRIIDIAEPTEPRLSGGFAISIHAKDIEITPDCGFVLADKNDLYAMDISDRTMPLAGPDPLCSNVEWFGVRNNMLFVLQTDLLQVFGLDDPFAPELMTSLDGMEGMTSVNISDDYLLVTADHMLYVYDNDLADGPEEVDRKTFFTPVLDAMLYDEYLYVLTEDEGVAVIDVSPPILPASLTTMDLEISGSDYVDMATSHDRLYVAEASEIHCIDLSTPESPAIVGNYDRSHIASFDVSGNVVALGTYFGIKLLDFTDPSRPDSIYTLFNPPMNEIVDIEIQDSTLWLCRETDGLIGLDFTPYIESVNETSQSSYPEVLNITAHPNPFNAACRIDVPQGFTAAIYDVHGRQVYTLPTGTSVWNAEDQPSGVYLVRAGRGNKTVEKRVVLVR